MPRQRPSSIESPSARPAPVIPLRAPESDASLVRSLQAGEAWAGSLLFDRHAPHVRRVLAHVLGPDPEIADILQDVFVAALSSIKKLSEPSALRAWLTRTAVFTARARIRRRVRWRFLRFVGHDELPELPAHEMPPEDRQALVRVYELIGRLPVEDRIAFALRVMEGMELLEVAEVCRVSLATAKRRVARAQRRFTELAAKDPFLRDRVPGGEP